MSLQEQIRSQKIREKIVEVDGLKYLLTGLGRVATTELMADSRDEAGDLIRDKLDDNLFARCVRDPETRELVAFDGDIPGHVFLELIPELLWVAGLSKAGGVEKKD